MAIMVGIETILSDDPSLTTRLEAEKTLDPVRIVVDSRGRIPIEAQLFTGESEAKVIVATTCKMSEQKRKVLEDNGASIIVTTTDDSQVNLKELMTKLGAMGIDSVLLEGGGTLNYSALSEGIVDKVITFIAPKIFGGQSAITPVEGVGVSEVDEAFLLEDIKVSTLDGDIMIEGYIRKDVVECLQD
jgi:diaminohydroxyphosphoribosylaminopyrimidine deaminase/5-amino-6-(5-phosphoribosylamino)uracil reductase